MSKTTNQNLITKLFQKYVARSDDKIALVMKKMKEWSHFLNLENDMIS